MFLALTLGIVQAQPSAPAPALTSWSAKYPRTGAVTIPAGSRVLLDTNLNLTDLTINGQVFCANKNLKVSAATIMIHGRLECGTPAKPYLKKLTITLTGSDPDRSVMGMGTKGIGVMSHGRLELHGKPVVTWLPLATTARRGATQLTLAKPSGWRPGDRIVVASTDFHQDHNEEFTVRRASGTTVQISKRLAYEHWCQRERFGKWTLNECGEVGLLTRNIVVQGDASSEAKGFGGHIMSMLGASTRLSNVELYRMGQRGILARYPMHWHLAGNAKGQYIVDSTIHHSFNRFVTIHGTHRVRLAGNVGYDTIGHGFYLEDGIETKNVIEGNLGIRVREAEDGRPTPSDNRPAIFWVSNPDNWIRDNVAVASDNIGFWLAFPEHPIGLSARDDIWPQRTPLREFAGNTAHSNQGQGLFVDGGESADRQHTLTTWYEPHEDPADDDSPIVTPYFRDFTAYKHRDEAIWMRSTAGAVITNNRLADNHLGIFLANLGDRTASFEDSLVVGESANKGNPDDWEAKGPDGREIPHPWAPEDDVRGLQFYDGPMAIQRTHFANFQPNAQRKSGALTQLAPNVFNTSPLSFSKANTFANATRVFLHTPEARHSGDAFALFRDMDGSVTGDPGAIVVGKNPVLYTSACTFRPPWNAYVCPKRFAYINVLVYAENGDDINETVISRAGAESKVWGTEEERSTQVNVNILADAQHALRFPGGTPDHLTFVVPHQRPGAARVSVPWAPGSFSVTLWGQPITKASSLSQLESGGHKYYYDAVGGRLHIRVGPGPSYDAIEIRRN